MLINKKILYGFMLVILTANSFVVSGQQSKRVLTNDDVIRMVKEDLADDVIVSTIRQFPANYDVSPDALIQMKRQGVSAVVLRAVQEAEKVKNSKSAEATASPESKTQQKRVSKVSNDFVFELNVCQSSGGDSITCWFFITNKAHERNLYITLDSHLDDNLGERYAATDVWIANKGRQYTFETSVKNTLIPGNPIVAALKFQNVKPEAKLIRILRIVCSLGDGEFKVDLLNIPITPKPQQSSVPNVEPQQEKPKAEDLERRKIIIGGTDTAEPKLPPQEKQDIAKSWKSVVIPKEPSVIIESPVTLPRGTTRMVSNGAPVYRIPFRYQVKRFNLFDLRQNLDLCAGTITIGKDSLEIVADSVKSTLGGKCNSGTYLFTKDDIQKLRDTLNNNKWYHYRPTTDYLYMKFTVAEKNGKDKKSKDFFIYPAEASIKYGTRTRTLTGRILVCPQCPAIVCSNCKEDLLALKNLLDQFHSQGRVIY